MDESIKSLPGVGDARAKYFEKLKIHTVSELLRLYPRRYDDLGNIIDIADAGSHRGEKVTMYAKVCGVITEKRLSGGRLLTIVPVSDESGATNLSYFNNKFIKNSLKPGGRYLFYGKIAQNGPPIIYNPEHYRHLPENGRLLPVYPLTSGISQSFMRKTVAKALSRTYFTETLPPEIISEHGLISLDNSIKKIHAPRNSSDIFDAKYRLIFEELLYFSLGLQTMKNRDRSPAAAVIPQNIPQEFLNAHGFLPTDAQNRALKDIYRDLQSGYSMHRLLQGDVGSGKTLVAGQCAFAVIRAGAQAAVMAPTEVLANQHFRYFEKMMAPLGVTCALLTSSVGASQKREIKSKLKSGDIQLVIGTHAVLQKDVSFANLGLVITDEQHRFGVMQRTELAQKGRGAHILVMSATPIPRTLALMLWGDLDLSVIDALPAGRQQIKTYLVNSSYSARLMKFIKKNIDDGGQVYYVCPAVEEDAENETYLTAAKTKKDELSAVFGKDSVGLVYGKMKSAEKDRAMQLFYDGKIKVLVSTTVIEVGVNVPNATLMIIDGADRFGLSQLHQLRGRVGRGSRASYCVLINDSESETAAQRLIFFAKTTNGFEIAKKDLSLRGPGNFFGAQQHGLPRMRIADLAEDTETVRRASECAKKILTEDPGLKNHPEILSNVTKLFEAYSLD
jgi:ATP-dependent DNA helicase RecG